YVLPPLAGLLLLPAARARPQDDVGDAHHSIVSIWVCRGNASDGSCVDTAMPVLSPDGTPINGAGSLANPSGAMATPADEHSTAFPPGTLPGHADYLFFVATRTTLEPNASGVTVLTGGKGPDANGQWTLDFAPDFGLYSPGGTPGATN